MADENLARADSTETKQETQGADAQATDTGVVHSNAETGNDDFAARVAKATTPDELARLTNEFLARGEKPVQAEEGETSPEQSSGQDSSKDAGEEGGEGSKANAGNVEEEATGEGEGKAEADLQDESEKEVARMRLRKRTSDKAGVRALEIQNRNPDLTLDECLQRARSELGIEPKAEAAAEAKPKETVKPKDGDAETVESVDNRIKDLKAARRKAMAEDLDFAKAADLDDQIDALKDKRAVIEAEQAKSKQQAASEYDSKFDTAQAKAYELYDFLRDPQGAESKRLLEIDATLKASGDPLYLDPEKPLILARMVAREYNIAPKSATSTKPATVAKASVTKPKPVAPIASGNSRTASTASNQAGQQILERASRIKSAAEMEDFLASLGRG